MLAPGDLARPERLAELVDAKERWQVEVPSLILGAHNVQGGIADRDGTVAARACAEVLEALGWAEASRGRRDPRPLLPGRRARGRRSGRALRRCFRGPLPRRGARGRRALLRGEPALDGDPPPRRAQRFAARSAATSTRPTSSSPGSTRRAEARALGSLIRRVHLKDTRERRGDCRLGEGRVDFAACAQALAEIGYDGWLVLETPPGPPAEVARRPHASRGRSFRPSDAEVEHDLDVVVRTLVEQPEELGRPLDRLDSRHERLELEPAVRGQPEHRALEPEHVPAAREPRVHRGDLRGDELDPVVVELLAEAQLVRAALREPGDDHAGRVGRAADRLVQRRGRAGQVDGHVRAAATGRVLDRVTRGGRRGIDGARAERGRELEAARNAVDCDDVGAAEPGELRRDQPGHALPVHRDGLADVDVGVEDRVQRDRSDPREDAPERRDRVEEPIGDGVLLEDRRAPVAPDPPDAVAGAEPRGVRAELDHLPHLLVAPVVERILERRAGGEDPARCVPPPGQVRVRPAVGGQLGAGGDARVQRPQPHLAGLRRPLLVGNDGDVVRPAERDRALAHAHVLRSHAAARSTAARDSGSRLIEKKPCTMPR